MQELRKDKNNKEPLSINNQHHYRIFPHITRVLYVFLHKKTRPWGCMQVRVIPKIFNTLARRYWVMYVINVAVCLWTSRADRGIKTTCLFQSFCSSSVIII